MRDGNDKLAAQLGDMGNSEGWGKEKASDREAGGGGGGDWLGDGCWDGGRNSRDKAVCFWNQKFRKFILENFPI